MSSSSEGEPTGSAREQATSGETLRYDAALPYAPAHDRLLLPRSRVDVQFFTGQALPMPVVPHLDTGAEYSVFDGRVAEQAGWSLHEIVRNAVDVKPMYGLVRRGSAMDSYVHEVACYIAFGARFADLRFSAVITPPNTVAFPVLLRAGFFEQVDVTVAEFEKMLYLRFRNPVISGFFMWARQPRQEARIGPFGPGRPKKMSTRDGGAVSRSSWCVGQVQDLAGFG